MQQISARYTMTRFEVFRGTWAIGPLRTALYYGAIVLLPFAIPLATTLHLQARDIAFIAVMEAALWAVVMFALLRQSSKLAVPTTAILTDEMVVLRLPTGNSGAPWPRFVRLKSTRRFWLFYVDRKCSLIIPKRAFDERQRAFVDDFVRRLGPALAQRASR